MLSEDAEKRTRLLQSMGLAFGTLRSAVSNINIGENIDGCEQSVSVSREIAQNQIDLIRRELTSLKRLM